MKTFMVQSKKITKRYHTIDAKGKILGRLSTKVSSILLGKDRVEYAPHLKMFNYVIVLNADKVVVTGKKYEKKFYFHHTGYVGGIKKISFREMIKRFPERIIEFSVKGMLPKNSLGRSSIRRLKVFSSYDERYYFFKNFETKKVTLI